MNKFLGLVLVLLTALLLSSCGSSSSTSPPEDPSTIESTTTAPTTTSSTTTTIARHSLSGKVIAIDAGHNGGNAAHSADINQLVDAGNGVTKACDTSGTASNEGYAEYEFTLSVSKDLQALLQAQGATVVMVRTDSAGWGPCITQRAKIGNDAHADIAISIHGDGNDSAGTRGFHVLVPQTTNVNAAIAPASNRFGTLLRDSFVTTGMPVSNYLGTNGIMPRGDLGGLNLSTVPKVFIECGNMRNATDASMMRSGTFQQSAAAAIDAAIVQFLN
ncbi:MAG: N-acetylmuramoyl-L-alanine amidase [Actinobacteria bacterium]|nr:N-acetylmuramoyl-L-alanine amidase [Actinomycetota bacterium]